MKTLFNRTLSILCAVMMLSSIVSAWAAAEEEPATPTDLNPSEREINPEVPGEGSEPEGEAGEESIDSVEVVITKALTVGQSWEGKMKKTKPAVLKLDVTRPGPVYMLVEGKDVWATVEKSDCLTENPARTQTDPETDWMVISWEAEEGSYLITLGPVEPNIMAMATVTFMSKKTHEEWEAEEIKTVTELEEEVSIQIEDDKQKSEMEEETESGSIEDGSKPESDETNENDSKDELEIEPVQKLESDQEVESEQEEDNPDTEETNLEQEEIVSEETEEPGGEEETEPRHIEVVSYDDFPNPVIGDTTHFRATLYGYDELVYTVQWQYSPDQITWYDVPGETELGMDIVITRENNVPYWRIVVYVEEVEEMVEDQES